MPLDKYALANQVYDLLESDLIAAGFELLDVRIFQGGGRLQVRVFVDTPGGINLDECTRAARTAGILLEESDLIPGQHVIEVSSPGIRRPLRKPKHFAPCIGQEVALRVATPAAPERIRGSLVAANDDGVTIAPLAQAGEEESPAAQTFQYRAILEANLESEFDVQALIKADRRKRKDQSREQRRANRRQRTTRRKRRSEQ
ncbi:MAG: ribosome maturation factor RimP [bacterium]